MGLFTKLFKGKEKVTDSPISVDDQVVEAIVEAKVEEGFDPNLDLEVMVSSCKTMADCKKAGATLSLLSSPATELRNQLSDITFEVFAKEYKKSKSTKKEKLETA